MIWWDIIYCTWWWPHMSHFVDHAYSWALYSYVSGTATCICSHIQRLIIVLYYWMAGSLTWFFITPLLWWIYNVFRSSCYPYNLTHEGASVTTYFTTHGWSHFYGLPCPSVDSLDPMDYFFTFDVSKIIPKNMLKLPYMTFNPFIVYIHGFDP